MVLRTKTLNIVGQVVVFFFMAFQVSFARAAIVHVKSKEPELENRAIHLLGDGPIGFVGDLIQLDEGEHLISIDGPEDYTLFFRLEVGRDGLKIVETGHWPPNCEPGLEVEWEDPKIIDSSEYDDVTVVLLGGFAFGAPTDFKSCIRGAAMGCTLRKFILTVESEPSGAEIWIGDHKLKLRTNATLSVPYCTYERSKRVMVRMEKRVNCVAVIATSPDSKHLVKCSLRGPVQRQMKTGAETNGNVRSGDTSLASLRFVKKVLTGTCSDGNEDAHCRARESSAAQDRFGVGADVLIHRLPRRGRRVYARAEPYGASDSLRSPLTAGRCASR